MSKTRFKWKWSGFDEVRKSDGVRQACREHATRLQARAGEGYVVEDRNYPSRAGAAVRPDTPEAHRDNLENNTLLKLIY